MADNPYGVTIFNFSATTNLDSLSQTMSDVALLGLNNGGWMRYQIVWQQIESPQGTYTWTALDNVVSACNAAGVNVVYSLMGAPTWALTTASMQADTVPQYLPDPTLRAGFASQVATRYNGTHGHGTIQAIEVDNEDFNSLITPVSAGYFGIQYSPYAEYNGLAGVTSNNVRPGASPHYTAQLLPLCSNAIRAAAPGMLVGMGAVTWNYIPNDTDFLAGLYAELPNAGSYYDFANLHYYPSVDPYMSSSAITLPLQKIIQAMQAAMLGGGDLKAIWITEFGWKTNNDGSNPANAVSQAQQSAYYQELLEITRLSNGAVRKVFFYTLNYRNDVESLIHKSGSTFSYLPAFTTLQNYIAQYPAWPADTALFPAAKRRGSATAGYAATVLSNAPLLYARLGDTQPLADDSANHTVGQINGTITRQASGLLVNDPNASMLFDGTSGYISFPTAGLPTGASPWTMEIWTKITSITQNAVPMSFGTFAANQIAMLFITNAILSLQQDSATVLSSTVAVTVGSVHHIAATYDGTTATLYQDGYAVAMGAMTFNLGSTFAYIGARGTPVARFYGGYLQDAAFYATCLTPQQILRHYQIGTIGLSGSVALFPAAKRRG